MADRAQTVSIRSRISNLQLHLCVTICTLLVAGGWVFAEGSLPPRSTIPALQETPVKRYRAFRRMRAANERFNQEGWVDCWTELDQRGFHYDIVSERGSDYVREKVLKTLLRREQELIAEGNAGRADINGDNYEVAEGVDAQDPGRRTNRSSRPKRRDVLLVDGRMAINQEGTELLRVEGRLSKNPSFWTSLVDIVREFTRVDGVRVPISTETVAKLKFAGTSRMDVRYEYETINGRPVSLAARRLNPPSFPRSATRSCVTSRGRA